MSRIWWDSRPTHLKEVVGWWDWHTPSLSRFVPGRCRECHQRHGFHKLSCTAKNKQPPRPTPWYVIVGFILGGVAVNFLIGYVFANWMPDMVGLWGWLVVSLIAATSYNVLLYRVYRDWRRVR